MWERKRFRLWYSRETGEWRCSGHFLVDKTLDDTLDHKAVDCHTELRWELQERTILLRAAHGRSVLDRTGGRRSLGGGSLGGWSVGGFTGHSADMIVSEVLVRDLMERFFLPTSCGLQARLWSAGGREE